MSYSGKIVKKVVGGESRLYVLGDTGGKKPIPVAREQLSPDLAGRSDEELDGTKVDYEYDSGKACNVRPKGSRNQAAAPRPVWPGPTDADTVGADTVGAGPADASRGGGANPARADGDPDAFHNPYSFVPALDRDTAHPTLGDRGAGDSLGSYGHDRLRPGRFTGSIRVRLRTETPLLLLDTSRYDQDAATGHKTFPVLERTVDGVRRPHLPPTAVKGMLRAAYEAVTNSRMGVFAGHDERLGYRMPAGDGLKSVPARVGDDGRIHLMLGTTALHGQGQAGQAMHAAWLPQYWPRREQRFRNVAFADGTRPAHAEHVWARVQRVRHTKGRVVFEMWWVHAIARNEADIDVDARVTPIPGKYEPLGDPRTVEGYACVTNNNIDNKHDERLFFADDEVVPPGSLAGGIPVEAVLPLWRRTIAAYQQARQPDPTRPDPRQPLAEASSRHLLDPEREKDLRPGDLLYVQFGERGSRQQHTVVGAYPVTISRGTYPVSPAQLLPDSVRPAARLSELSPADRVFGWVRTDADHGNGNGRGRGRDRDHGRAGPIGAWQGCLRIGPVTCLQASDGEPGAETETETRAPDGGGRAVTRFGRDGLPLAILGEPKPAQGRFYVGSKSSVGPQPLADTPRPNPRPQWYSSTEARTLRGRKVYPHHADLPEGYWDDPKTDRTQTLRGDRYQEYRRPLAAVDDDHPLDPTGTRFRTRRPGEPGAEQRDNQNRSIRGWVNPRTTFEFTVEVRNLTGVELGALLWLLDLDAGRDDTGGNSVGGNAGENATGRNDAGRYNAGGNSADGNNGADGNGVGGNSAAGNRARGNAAGRGSGADGNGAGRGSGADGNGAVRDGNSRPHFHRLGLGKPLGFGSVALTIDWNRTTLADGADWADYYLYLDLTPAPAPGAREGDRDGEPVEAMRALGRGAVSDFRRTAAGSGEFDRLRHIQAFLAAAAGDSSAPVHYPRAPEKGWQGTDRIPPDPRGRSYAWFVANESPRNVTQVLPDPGRGTLSVRHEEVERPGWAGRPAGDGYPRGGANGGGDHRGGRRGRAR